MASNLVSLSAQSAGLKYEPTFQDQPSLTAQTVATGEESKDSIIKKTKVTLVGKPPDVAIGEYLTRQALEKIAPEYGLNSTDIDLEIQYVKNKKNGNFIEDLSFGGKTVAKPNDLTDKQVNALVAAGNKNVNFGIHQSTVERMQERKTVLKWIAEKEAFGGSLSAQDKADLVQLGYADQDIANLCKTKFMEYGGFQTRFENGVEEKAKQQVYQDTFNDLKGTLFEDRAKANAQGSEEAFNLLMNAEVKNRVDDKLRYGKKSAIQYLTEQEGEKQRIAAKGELNERLKQYSVTDYLAEGGKNLVNSLYWGIGEAVKGVSLVAMNNTLYIDKNGKEVRPKLSETLGYKIGDWIQQNVQAPNVNRDIEQSISGGTVPKTVGGLLPAVFGAWVTKSPTAVVSIYDGLRTGGSIYDEAIKHRASESEAQRAALITGGFVGITDRFGYGKTLETLNAGSGAATWQGIFKEAIKDGARNSVVAGGQTLGENVIAKNIYDPNRGYLDNVRERMIAAGITGAALKGGLEIVAKVKAGTNPQTLAQTQQIFRIEKSPVQLNAKQIEFRNSGVDFKAKLNEKLGKVNNQQTKTEQLAQVEAAKLTERAKHNEPLITKNLQTTANQVNGEIVGLDKRFKIEESLTRKFADRTQEKVDRAVKNNKDVELVRLNSIAKEVEKNNDALRYTITFSPDKYVGGYNSTVKALEEQGYKIKQSDNYWMTKGTKNDTGYRGINATFIAPNGQKFELQFHTPESFKFKNDNHYLYEEARQPDTSKKRKDELILQNIKTAEPLIIPIGIEKIGDQK